MMTGVSPGRIGVACLVMSGLGSGYMPFASGTWGSLAAAALGFACWAGLHAGGATRLLDPILLVLTVLASAGCVRWGDWAIDYYAARSRKAGDPGVVVIDEFAGQWVSLLLIPMPTLQRALIVFAVQFFLFRLFDVLKPPPARQLERLHGGWGILCDDLAAGVYANVVGQLLLRFVL